MKKKLFLSVFLIFSFLCTAFAKGHLYLRVCPAGQNCFNLESSPDADVIVCNGPVSVGMEFINELENCMGSSVEWYWNDSLVSTEWGYLATDTGTYDCVFYLPGCGYGSTYQVRIKSILPKPVVQPRDSELVTALFPGYTYQWYFESQLIAGADSNVFEPRVTGYYGVMVQNMSGCRNFSSWYYFKKDEPYQGAFETSELFPNPATEEVKFQYSLGTGHDARTELMDVSGKLVSNGNLQSGQNNTFSYPTGLLPPGFYFCRIYLDGNLFSVKKVVIIQ